MKKKDLISWTIHGVPRTLKNAFMGKCHAQGKKAKDVLIELVKCYVEEIQKRG